MVDQTRAYKNTGRSFLRWSRNQVNRIIRYLLCVFLCEKFSSELARQGDELPSALISSQLGCHISRYKNAGQSETRRLPVERIVGQTLQRFVAKIVSRSVVPFHINETRWKMTQSSHRTSRAWRYRRNFRGCMRRIYIIHDIFFLVKKSGITVRDKGMAMATLREKHP